jgi:hypothetical protein
MKRPARPCDVLELASQILERITGDDCYAQYSHDSNKYVMVRFDHSGKEVHT